MPIVRSRHPRQDWGHWRGRNVIQHGLAMGLGALGLGAWDYDAMTGEWVDTGTADNSGNPVFSVTGTAPMPDPNADDGLPGKPPCSPNALYPRGHRCDVLQQYRDAQQVVRVVDGLTAPGTAPIVGQSITQQLNAAGAQAASWVSRNAGLAAIGLVGVLVLGMVGGRKGGRR